MWEAEKESSSLIPFTPLLIPTYIYDLLSRCFVSKTQTRNGLRSKSPLRLFDVQYFTDSHEEYTRTKAQKEEPDV